MIRRHTLFFFLFGYHTTFICIAFQMERLTYGVTKNEFAQSVIFPGVKVSSGPDSVAHQDDRSHIAFSGRADELYYPDDMISVDEQGALWVKTSTGSLTLAGQIQVPPTSGGDGSSGSDKMFRSLPSLTPSHILSVEEARVKAESWIASEIDRNMRRFYVYAGGDYGNNRASFCANFSQTGGGSDLYDFAPLPSSFLADASRQNGLYAKRWTVDLAANTWAAINFQTGLLNADGSVGPSSGLTAQSKVDLGAYRRLRVTLWADADDTVCNLRTGDASPEHPDTLTRELARGIQLSTVPREFVFDLTEDGDDLSSMDTFLTLAIDFDIAPQKQHVIYVANVYYEQTDLSRPSVFDEHGCWIKSWTTKDPAGEFDIVMQNASFVYDQALALYVMLAGAESANSSSERERFLKRATWLARALVFAIENDTVYDDGRLRNAYMCGPASPPAGFEARGARPPGWWPREGTSARDGTNVFVGEEGVYGQDEYAISTWTGNVAWAVMALCACSEQLRRSSTSKLSTDVSVSGIDEAALAMGGFLEARKKDDGYGGFSGGVFGFDGSQTEIAWRSTEHSADVYAACASLARLPLVKEATDSDTIRWTRLARHALRFTDRMFYDGALEDGSSAVLYWTGTDPDGSINKSNLPLDPIVWTIYGTGLLRADAVRLRALEWADDKLRVNSHDPFSLAKYSVVSGGGWIEGSGQMATCFNVYGLSDYGTATLTACLPHQLADGGFYSVDRDLETGFDLPGMEDRAWFYLRRQHVGGTCWFALAAAARNPFDMPFDGII
jgi:hypothetical protein